MGIPRFDRNVWGHVTMSPPHFVRWDSPLCLVTGACVVKRGFSEGRTGKCSPLSCRLRNKNQPQLQLFVVAYRGDAAGIALLVEGGRERLQSPWREARQWNPERLNA